MKTLKTWIALSLLLAVVGVTAVTFAGDGESAEPAASDAASLHLKSVGPLEMSPDGTLFVADSQAGAVYALELGSGEAPGDAVEYRLEDLDAKIADRLGTSPRDVFIRDLAVHPTTGVAYLAVTRGEGEAAVPVLLSVTPDGAVAEVPATTPHTKLALADVPAEDAKMYRWPSRTLTVTDMEWMDGEIWIAGLSNEEFASQLRRAPYPFTGEVEATGLEIYHGAHGEYETFAPIFAFMPYELDGKPHILASYLCTPLVTFSVDELKSKDKLRGKTIAELGYGNLPLDMLPFQGRDGEDYVLLTNNRRGTMRIPAKDIRDAQKRPGITEEVGPRHGVDYLSSPVGSVVQVTEQGADKVLMLSRSLENGSLVLQSVDTARL